MLIKTVDIGQMIMEREEGDTPQEGVEYRHGLTPPMRDARRQRFRREPDLNPELVHQTNICIMHIEGGRTGTFVIDNLRFPAALLDLPCIVESYKTYNDSVLIKATDISQMIMVREESDTPQEGVEYRHDLTPPMRDARRRRF